MSDLVWPDRPTCHDDTSGHHAEWRGPRARRDDPPDSDPYQETFRRCSYCGSIHPEDLYGLLVGKLVVEYEEFDPNAAIEEHGADGYQSALSAHYAKREEAGVHVGGSDWKYGWPHKFYIDGIPNPIAGLRNITYQYGGLDDDGRPLPSPRPYSEHTCPTTQRAKWYNDHLRDLAPETFAVFAPLLAQHSGIEFSLTDDGELRYSAPHRGYQH